MPNDIHSQRLAILIDADNASAVYAHAIFDEIAKLGEANVRRIYGDFSNTRLKGWRDILQTLAIAPRQTFNNVTGKNAADIALVIDAMDLMHRSELDGFCLVSSDSDFTGLAQRLREDNKLVYGFGEKKTPEAFRNACSRFIYLENLVEEAEEGTQAASAPTVSKEPVYQGCSPHPAGHGRSLEQQRLDRSGNHRPASQPSGIRLRSQNLRGGQPCHRS